MKINLSGKISLAAALALSSASGVRAAGPAASQLAQAAIEAQAVRPIRALPPAAQIIEPGRPAGIVAAADPADDLIRGLKADAEKKGRKAASKLFGRLLNEGTREEKQAFMDAKGEAYVFPERLEPAIQPAGVCEWITETFCKVSCWGTGVERQCQEDCRDVIVKSCSN